MLPLFVSVCPFPVASLPLLLKFQNATGWLDKVVKEPELVVVASGDMVNNCWTR
jgi:hypothetical protein